VLGFFISPEFVFRYPNTSGEGGYLKMFWEDKKEIASKMQAGTENYLFNLDMKPKKEVIKD